MSDIHFAWASGFDGTSKFETCSHQWKATCLHSIQNSKSNRHYWGLSLIRDTKLQLQSESINDIRFWWSISFVLGTPSRQRHGWKLDFISASEGFLILINEQSVRLNLHVLSLCDSPVCILTIICYAQLRVEDFRQISKQTVSLCFCFVWFHWYFLDSCDIFTHILS